MRGAELLLPRIALPVRMHECRAYRGVAERSFANTLVGVMARLVDNKNLEPGLDKPCDSGLIQCASFEGI